jgi:hypothetical protein
VRSEIDEFAECFLVLVGGQLRLLVKLILQLFLDLAVLLPILIQCQVVWLELQSLLLKVHTPLFYQAGQRTWAVCLREDSRFCNALGLYKHFDALIQIL